MENSTSSWRWWALGRGAAAALALLLGCSGQDTETKGGSPPTTGGARDESGGGSGGVNSAEDGASSDDDASSGGRGGASGGRDGGGGTGGGGTGGGRDGGGAGGSGGRGGTGGGGSGGTGAGGTMDSGGAAPRVEAIDSVLHVGVDCVLIRTEVADYYFDKAGAGLVSLIDTAGHDWISWSQSAGPHGMYRGIPNMGPCCHPGYSDAITTVMAQEPERVVVRAASGQSAGSEQSSWEISWEFFPDHAIMTVVRAPSSYYLLYEGTPGGSLGPEDYVGLSDGRLSALDTGAFLEDLPDPEWVYFLDTAIDRALLLVHPQADTVPDTYWTFDTMTVFGFGRTCAGACAGMTRSGDQLILALTDDTSFEAIAAQATRWFDDP